MNDRARAGLERNAGAAFGFFLWSLYLAPLDLFRRTIIFISWLSDRHDTFYSMGDGKIL